jgi:shikimate dehydrogenase
MVNNSTPKIYGVLGFPAKHSLSPAIHNFAFRKLNLSAEYRIFEIEPAKLEDFLSLNNLVKENIWGLNITIPYKVEVFNRRLRESVVPSKDANRYLVLTGAVNTIKRENSKIYYYNTDCEGFINSLQNDFELRFDTTNKNVFLIGCGGAGRAVIAGLTMEGMGIKKIYLYDINSETMEDVKKHFDNFDFLKNKLEFISTELIPDKIKASGLLVNASPSGMKEGDPIIIKKELLHKDLYVYDVIYNRETELIKEAKKICGKEKVLDGRYMLYRQAEVSFKIWTGKKFPVGTREELEKGLNKCQK